MGEAKQYTNEFVCLDNDMSLKTPSHFEICIRIRISVDLGIFRIAFIRIRTAQHFDDLKQVQNLNSYINIRMRIV